MSVTQNYKTVTFTSSAANFVSNMVSMRLEANRAALVKVQAPHIKEFLDGEIALCLGVQSAMNSPLCREDTRGALEGENLQTAIAAMRCMLRERRGERWALLGAPTNEALSAALHFLENPK